MLSIVLLSPSARVASDALARRLLRLLGWTGLVLFGCSGWPRRRRRRRRGARRLRFSTASAPSPRQGRRGRRARGRSSVGQLDPRLRLAPCQSIEPYLPPGVRLWGKAGDRLRCKAGPTPWNVYLPITVKVFGRALVVPAARPPAASCPRADLAEAEVDLPRTTPALADPPRGRPDLAQSLKPGQTLRQTT
jgi:hypothetical protein